MEMDKKFIDYRDYIQSTDWKVRRSKKIRAVGCQCEYPDGCSETDHLEVHHISYENLGNELDEDLMVLCHYHHRVIEYKKKYSVLLNFFLLWLREKYIVSDPNGSIDKLSDINMDDELLLFNQIEKVRLITFDDYDF